MGEGTARDSKQTKAPAIKKGRGKAKTTRGAAAPVAPAPVDVLAQRWVVTTIRIEQKHWQALRMAAVERATARGTGKADASEVLREVLNDWMSSSSR